MKPIRNALVVSLIFSICAVSFSLLHAQNTATPDSIVQVTAEAQGLSLVSPGDFPNASTFWVVDSNSVFSPWPCPPPNASNLPIYDLTGEGSTFLVDATGGQVATDSQQSVADAVAALADSVDNLINQVKASLTAQPQIRMAGRSMVMSMDDLGDGDLTPAFSFPTNGLWLQITNVANGLAYMNLMNGTDFVYEIYSKTDLTATNWDIAGEVFPTDTNCMPFTVPELDQTNLFIWARDWTGITSNGNETPDWWFWKYFGTTDLSDTNLDSVNQPVVNDFQEDIDPNIIFFTLQFPNEVQNAVTNGAVTIIGGQPFYEAVLVNDTNTADANWQPYSGTNVAVCFDSGNGVYTVCVGLRGLPKDSTTTWVTTQSVLFQPSAPAFVITSPATMTVSQPMIQVQGQVSETLSSMSFDVSNAAGIFTNQPGYWQPAFYDTNVLNFTTNTFQCYDVQLTNGLNTITLYATDLAGNMTTTNISVTLDYFEVTNPPALAVIWPTNGTVISGTNFTLQAQVDDPTASVAASITDTNGDTNVVQGLVERSGLVWLQDLPMGAGTNTITVSAVNGAGYTNNIKVSIVQSSDTMTTDPISSDQLNQTNITVTGTLSNPADNVVVNGVEADYYDDAGNWAADGVPVNATGTAYLNVQLEDASYNPLGTQNIGQPQPATVALMSYTSHSHSDATWYNDCKGPAESVSDETMEWLYQTGGTDSGGFAGWNGDCDRENYSYANGLAGGSYGFSPAWEINNTSGTIYYGPVWEYLSHWNKWIYISNFELGGWSSNAHARVMVVPSGQSAVGQTILYLVQAQVLDMGTGLQLAANAVQFMNQLAGTTTEDVTNDDGSVWTEAVVSGAAGANVEVTPSASRFQNISFSSMKLSKLVYISVDSNNKPSTFDAQQVQSTFQSELFSNVFYSLPTGEGVQIMVHVRSSYGGNLGWNSSKQTYVSRVVWNQTYAGGLAASPAKDGNTTIDPIACRNYNTGSDPGIQFWVNILAHETIWLNVCGGADHDLTPPADEISSGLEPPLTASFTVWPANQAYIISKFGF